MQIDDDSGEILVARDPSRACIEVHIRGEIPDEYRIVRLNRYEARRLHRRHDALANRLAPDAHLHPDLMCWPDISGERRRTMDQEAQT